MTTSFHDMESFTSFLRRGNSRSSILLRVYIHIYTYVSIYPYIVSSYQDFYSLAVTEKPLFRCVQESRNKQRIYGDRRWGGGARGESL